METNTWVTMSEALALTGRKRRTIRRWIATGNIETVTADDGRTRLLSRPDLMATEARKTEYATRPTFTS